MPKEVIHQQATGAPGVPGQPFRLVVGWERDASYAQIGIETTERSDGQHHILDQIYGDAPTLTRIGQAMLETLDCRGLLQTHGLGGLTEDEKTEHLAALGRDVLDAVTGSEPFGTSVWVSMDRTGLNTLIRHSRRARDAAFGRDE